MERRVTEKGYSSGILGEGRNARSQEQPHYQDPSPEILPEIPFQVFLPSGLISLCLTLMDPACPSRRLAAPFLGLRTSGRMSYGFRPSNRPAKLTPRRSRSVVEHQNLVGAGEANLKEGHGPVRRSVVNDGVASRNSVALLYSAVRGND